MVAGMVKTHEIKIALTGFQRTFPNRSEAPEPMIAELTTCVVLTGKPVNEEIRMSNNDPDCAEKLFTGRIL